LLMHARISRSDTIVSSGHDRIHTGYATAREFRPD
jgi:hypothetical protein